MFCVCRDLHRFLPTNGENLSWTEHMDGLTAHEGATGCIMNNFSCIFSKRQWLLLPNQRQKAWVFLHASVHWMSKENIHNKDFTRYIREVFSQLEKCTTGCINSTSMGVKNQIRSRKLIWKSLQNVGHCCIDINVLTHRNIQKLVKYWVLKYQRG